MYNSLKIQNTKDKFSKIHHRPLQQNDNILLSETKEYIKIQNVHVLETLISLRCQFFQTDLHNQYNPNHNPGRLFFFFNGKLFLKFIWKCKGPKQRSIGGLTVPGLKFIVKLQ